MSAQHKRPGRKARQERVLRAQDRDKHKAVMELEEQRRRDRIKVHVVHKNSAGRFDKISPGLLRAWADGRAK